MKNQDFWTSLGPRSGSHSLKTGVDPKIGQYFGWSKTRTSSRERPRKANGFARLLFSIFSSFVYEVLANCPTVGLMVRHHQVRFHKTSFLIEVGTQTQRLDHECAAFPCFVIMTCAGLFLLFRLNLLFPHFGHLPPPLSPKKMSTSRAGERSSSKL